MIIFHCVCSCITCKFSNSIYIGKKVEVVYSLVYVLCPTLYTASRLKWVEVCFLLVTAVRDL